MFLEEQRTGSVSLSNVTATASSMPGAVTDSATFNGLLLVDAQLNDRDFSFRVAVSVVWQGEAFLIEAFEDEAQARAWLTDAVRLVEWNRSGLTAADPSGLYWKQASVPAWVECWKQREDRASREATDEDDARLFRKERLPYL